MEIPLRITQSTATEQCVSVKRYVVGDGVCECVCWVLLLAVMSAKPLIMLRYFDLSILFGVMKSRKRLFNGAFVEKKEWESEIYTQIVMANAFVVFVVIIVVVYFSNQKRFQ